MSDKQYYGLAEIMLLIEEALKNSNFAAALRENKLMHIIICLTQFYTSCRGSSLGPAGKRNKEEDKVPWLPSNPI
jgi:hypothetical protein